MTPSNAYENTSLLPFALQYAEMGLSVIPVGVKKTPLVKWQEYQTKRASEAEIRAWWEKFPSANIGIVTGKISGIVVVDIDTDKTTGEMGNYEDLPKTAFAVSGSGGRHFYYSYPEGEEIPNATRIRTLADIRGEGGYIIAPPSLHASGKKYAWSTPFERESLAPFPTHLFPKESFWKEPISLDGEVAEGERNDTATRIIGKILRETPEEEWKERAWKEFCEWNSEKCLPPLGQKELRGIFESIAKREKGQRREEEKESGSLKERKKKGGKEEKLPEREIYSKRLSDGRIVETLYNREKEETEFVIWKDGEMERASSVEFNGVVYVPVNPNNSLLKRDFVKLAENVAPYPSETELFEQIKQFLHHYLEVTESFENILAYYVMFSYVADEFQELPYIRAIGDLGTGKSRFLKTIGSLCYKAVFLNGAASSAAIFRMIDAVGGTLVFDEADFQFSDTTAEIIKILNSGFQKGMPVLRAEGNNKTKSFDPTAFDVFGPKIIATRKNFSDLALESRCLTETMKIMTREDIPINLDKDFEEWAGLIRIQLLYFRFQKLSKGVALKEFPIRDIEPRLRQIITPLYSIVEDEAQQQNILDFVLQKQGQMLDDRFNSFDGQVFRAYMELLEEGKKEPELKEIAERCVDGKYPVKPQTIGNLLKSVLCLKTHRKNTGTVVKDCEDNEDQRKRLTEKYGYTEPEVNTVKTVNTLGEGVSKNEEVEMLTTFEQVVAVLDADD
jgi:hypothetical protein